MQAHHHSFQLIPFSPTPNAAAGSEAGLDHDLFAKRQPGSILHSTRLSLVGQSQTSQPHNLAEQAEEYREAVGVILSGLSDSEINEMLDATFSDNMNDTPLLSPCAYEAADEEGMEKHFALL